MVKFEHNKLIVSEMFTDKNGKTSPTKVCGVVMCGIGTLGFTVSFTAIVWIIAIMKGHEVDYTNVLTALQSVLMQALGLCGLGTTALGINRLSKDTDIKDATNNELQSGGAE